MTATSYSVGPDFQLNFIPGQINSFPQGSFISSDKIASPAVATNQKRKQKKEELPGGTQNKGHEKATETTIMLMVLLFFYRSNKGDENEF